MWLSFKPQTPHSGPLWSSYTIVLIIRKAQHHFTILYYHDSKGGSFVRNLSFPRRCIACSSWSPNFEQVLNVHVTNVKSHFRGSVLSLIPTLGPRIPKPRTLTHLQILPLTWALQQSMNLTRGYVHRDLEPMNRANTGL